MLNFNKRYKIGFHRKNWRKHQRLIHNLSSIHHDGTMLKFIQFLSQIVGHMKYIDDNLTVAKVQIHGN